MGIFEKIFKRSGTDETAIPQGEQLRKEDIFGTPAEKAPVSATPGEEAAQSPIPPEEQLINPLGTESAPRQ